MLRHCQVADADFPQVIVHILAKPIENALSHTAKPRFLPDPLEEQRQMQHDQLKSAFDGVRHAVVPVKGR